MTIYNNLTFQDTGYFQHTRETLLQDIESTESKQTRRKTNGDINHFKRWLKSTNNDEREPENIPESEIEIYLASFLSTIRQKNGEQYQPGTLQAKKNSINRYLKRKDYSTDVNNMKLTKDSLKSKQKSLKNMGMGDFPNAAEYLDPEEEEKIWNSLDLNDPEGLQNAMWLVIQKHCALRGSESAKQLKWGDVTLKTDPNHNEILEFTERRTKTRNGTDLDNMRAFKPCLFATPAIPDRCPVNIYKRFRAHRPAARMDPNSNFYISINHNRVAGSQIWYKDSNLGVKMIESMLKRMCQKAGVEGKKTNHSLRKTACQTLINSGMPPAYIKQLTGHKNIGSLERYGTASRAIQETMSDIIATRAMSYQNPLANVVGRNVQPQAALGAPPAPLPIAAPPGAPAAPSIAQVVPPVAQPTNVTPPAPLALAAPPALPPTVSMPAAPSTATLPNGNPTSNYNPLPMLFQGATITGNPSITINYNCLSQQQSQFQHRAERQRIRNVIESDSDSD